MHFPSLAKRGFNGNVALMDDQLALFDSPSTDPRKFSLFLALQPDPAMAENIHRLAADLRATRNLGGTLRPVHHLHITLHYFGHFPHTPEQTVEAIDRACTEVGSFTAPFVVKMDQILSFQSKPGNYPFVLAGREDANPALVMFYQMLARGLAVHGVRILASGKTFTPHITMQYTRELIPPAQIESFTLPINEFVLIRSEVGATKYTHLGRWKLGS